MLSFTCKNKKNLMKLTTREVKINQFYVKSVFTILFLKVTEFATS